MKIEEMNLDQLKIFCFDSGQELVGIKNQLTEVQKPYLAKMEDLQTAIFKAGQRIKDLQAAPSEQKPELKAVKKEKGDHK